MVIYYKKSEGNLSIILRDGKDKIELECDDMEGVEEIIDSIVGNCNEVNVSSPEID